MTFLHYLLGSTTVQESDKTVPVEEEDEVFPVHTLDHAGSLKALILTRTMFFNDVLEKGKVHASLVELLNIGDWRKAGGRIRQIAKEPGQLEYYVPRIFTAERPAVSFTSKEYDMAVEDHPLGARIPRASKNPCLYPAPEDFREFAAPENAPESIRDYLAGDVPMLSLHITTFKNCTIIGLTWPHTLMDVMGHQALLHAWSLVMNGKLSEVPPVLGVREDMLVQAAEKCKDMQVEFVLKSQIMNLWALLKVLGNFAWNIFWWRNMETRTISLPPNSVAKLRREAQMDLAEQQRWEEKPFISEGDVLTAWTMRVVASTYPKSRPITAMYALNARFRLRSLIEARGVFLQNMFVAGFTFVEHSVASGPLGTIALLNRQSLTEQATEAQILGNILELRKQPPGRVDPIAMICGSPDALLMSYSNWSRADLLHATDFSAAVIKAGETGPDRLNPPGTYFYHHSAAMRQGLTARNFVMIYGKDHAGNYWITARLLPAAWAKLEQEMKQM